jgi:hypothetical protein
MHFLITRIGFNFHTAFASCHLDELTNVCLGSILLSWIDREKCGFGLFRHLDGEGEFRKMNLGPFIENKFSGYVIGG